ncbi:MAG: amidase [Burkholderiaceae bacterium]
MTHALTASAAASRIRAGELTSEALVRACLERIALREPEVGAWEFLAAEQAMAQAREADRSRPCGPLHGVPIGVKDIMDTQDMPTTLGSPIYAGRRPAWDASCVAAARAAGAIVLGKTVSTEFAYFQPGKTRNPHNVLHTPGGSSSGSAAAVAAGMVPFAFGSQTAGSVIRPAAFCGVFGYKASHGEFSLSGIRPFAESLDSLGMLARSIQDIALFRAVLLGSSEFELAALQQPPRFGLCRTAQWAVVDAASRQAMEDFTLRCRDAGAFVSEVTLPDHFGALVDVHKTIMAYEAAHNYIHETTCRSAQLSASFLALAASGRQIPRASYAQARESVAVAAHELRSISAGLDALITPAAPGEAPLASTGTGDPIMSRMWTALHLPALSVPVGYGPSGMPLAVQLIAANGADDRLLQVGQWLKIQVETA